MFDLFLTGPYVPFTVSLALLFGLLTLELLLAVLGGTLLGMGADADADFDVDMSDLADFGNLDVEMSAGDIADFEIATPEDVADAAESSTASVGPTSWLGIGKVPVMIWVAAVLLGFGLSGLILQQVANATVGFAMPVIVAIVPAAYAGLWFARRFSIVFARILPKTETAAISKRHLGRRTGTVTQGTAQRGNPAEVRVTDRYGNFHYLRAEPLKDSEVIPAGTSVLVLRHRRDEGYRLLPLNARA